MDPERMLNDLVGRIAEHVYECDGLYRLFVGDEGPPFWKDPWDSTLAPYRDLVRDIITGKVWECAPLHERWMRRKLVEGWQHGDYDPDRKRHPYLCRYHELPYRYRARDRLVFNTTRLVFCTLRDSSPAIESIPSIVPSSTRIDQGYVRMRFFDCSTRKRAFVHLDSLVETTLFTIDDVGLGAEADGEAVRLFWEEMAKTSSQEQRDVIAFTDNPVRVFNRDGTVRHSWLNEALVGMR